MQRLDVPVLAFHSHYVSAHQVTRTHANAADLSFGHAIPTLPNSQIQLLFLKAPLGKSQAICVSCAKLCVAM